MKRCRFYLDKQKCRGDFRPVKWPIKYPYWCSGQSDTHFILISYADSVKDIKELWPEVNDSDFDFIEECDKITFTSRFPKPEWFTPKNEKK